MTGDSESAPSASFPLAMGLGLRTGLAAVGFTILAAVIAHFAVQFDEEARTLVLAAAVDAGFTLAVFIFASGVVIACRRLSRAPDGGPSICYRVSVNRRAKLQASVICSVIAASGMTMILLALLTVWKIAPPNGLILQAVVLAMCFVGIAFVLIGFVARDETRRRQEESD